MVPEEMQTINSNSRFHVKIQLPERSIIIEFKIRFQFFRFENKKVLQKIDSKRKQHDYANYIINKWRQQKVCNGKVKLSIELTYPAQF